MSKTRKKRGDNTIELIFDFLNSIEIKISKISDAIARTTKEPKHIPNVRAINIPVSCAPFGFCRVNTNDNINDVTISSAVLNLMYFIVYPILVFVSKP